MHHDASSARHSHPMMQTLFPVVGGGFQIDRGPTKPSGESDVRLNSRDEPGQEHGCSTSFKIAQTAPALASYSCKMAPL